MKPKFDKERSTPITSQCGDALKELRSESLHFLPDARVFCYVNGDELGFTWWTKRFRSAMVAAGFIQDEETKIKVDRKENTAHTFHNPRGLRPHSFRHSLNTILRDAGFDAGKIRASMGWAGEKVQEGYTDWKAMDYSKQREIIERRLE